MSYVAHTEIVEVFLQGAQVVAAAVGDPAVVAAWDRPSVLEEQRVGGLAGHLARGAVWVVSDYLDGGVPGGPVDFSCAGEYFAALVSAASAEDHQAVRDRGAQVAAAGHEELRRTLDQRLEALGPRLRSLDVSHRIAVVGGKVMRLEDYLTTRIVEQVVHLDDLARSVGRTPWPLPAGAAEVAIAVGADIAVRRSGGAAVIRALYRRGWSEPVLPVL